MSEHSTTPVALITGASSGIGKATAIAFAKAGARVVVAARRIKESEDVVESIKQAGDAAVFFQTDVSRVDDVRHLVQRTVATYGRLDWACNNAAIGGTLATVTDCTEENWQAVINVNLTGLWLCMKYELIQLLNHNAGAIVNIASVSAYFGSADLPAYTASK